MHGGEGWRGCGQEEGCVAGGLRGGVSSSETGREGGSSSAHLLDKGVQELAGLLQPGCRVCRGRGGCGLAGVGCWGGAGDSKPWQITEGRGQGLYKALALSLGSTLRPRHGQAEFEERRMGVGGRGRRPGPADRRLPGTCSGPRRPAGGGARPALGGSSSPARAGRPGMRRGSDVAAPPASVPSGPGGPERPPCPGTPARGRADTRCRCCRNRGFRARPARRHTRPSPPAPWRGGGARSRCQDRPRSPEFRGPGDPPRAAA